MKMLGAPATALVGALAISGAAAAASPQAADWTTCRPMTDAAARLACYDAAADRLTAHKSEERSQTFGLPPETVLKQVAPAATPTEVRAQVHVVRGGQAGRLVIELDNGQVWEQVIATPDALVEPGQAVTIRSAALGSFQMTTASGRTYKVRRIR